MKLPKSTRFQAWIALMVFSAVAVGALVDDLGNRRSSKDKWVISILSVSLIFSSLLCLAHFAGDAVIGKGIEGAMGGFLLAWWCAGLATIMNASNNYAIAEAYIEGQRVVVIKNANLYFSSWICFFAVVYIVGHFAQATKMVGSETIQNQAKVVKWYLLLAASVVVLAASADIMIDRKCRKDGSSICIRTKYALSLGCVAAFFSVVSIAMSLGGNMMVPVECGIAFILFGMYCAGVAVITGGTGPGTSVGNLYFSSWIGFTASLGLVAACIQEMMHKEAGGDEEPKASEASVEVGEA